MLARVGVFVVGLVLSALGALLAIASFVVHVRRSRDEAPGGRRRTIWLTIGGVLVALVAAPTGCYVGCSPYLWPEKDLQRVAEQGNKIVAAIKRYETERGAPPESLERLVPEYLDAIPMTGYSGHGEWEYRTSDDKSWSLCVAIYGPIPLDFDEFDYMPDHDPTVGCRSFVRYQDWVYFDD